MPDLLFTGPEEARLTLMLAHGAGAPMDSGWMNAMAERLAGHGIRVARFEFGYMAARRSGQRKPPPRAETLLGEYRGAVETLGPTKNLFIGGKSLGGRVASMVADGLFAEGKIAGLVCLGYPFHPPAKPEQLRAAHLKHLSAPTLICQGTRDPFGTREEVSAYELSPRIGIDWLEDGDHEFKPRKPLTLDGNLDTAAAAVASWMQKIGVD
ncbi:putative alpha/beta-hydrolase family hydrolase [Mesorhizobium soli]|uniref:alpha/beta hydrolase family protein n=1 Tax=Pseudaminobacter soli (ex Li et al. 2025) TaxID=1295366 RepID=UPI002474F8E3|nr:alpha/beta family hydrolase [Mesorhizobium soli]MDH6234482.1 putative alpha/beta-hydrolase family hydrolase [Mesorhizobium soli]